MDLNKIYQNLEQTIIVAEKSNKPIDLYVKKQIEILETVRDQFLKKYPEPSEARDKIELQQLSTMEKLAEKIGISAEQYRSAKNQIMIRVFGEDFVNSNNPIIKP